MRTLESMWSTQRLRHLSESLGTNYQEAPQPTPSQSSGWTTALLLKLGKTLKESHWL